MIFYSHRTLFKRIESSSLFPLSCETREKCEKGCLGALRHSSCWRESGAKAVRSEFDITWYDV
ncbi:hypothetical protein EZV77_24795 [Burkholderia thailandensis]|nr:hypothetical protein A8H32_10690 [Burkholderia thailandensis]MDD1479132.1 hypothetical protein [Burkholderia thailandensis]MDD1485831.1 hypothetical protein [Burkholderia thailandensis]MDD1491003.1 hypothetical protein [Burkholderia thailandensis]PJO74063.1 hypothetical protein CWD92_01765 [Burkholderia thailandensis]